MLKKVVIYINLVMQKIFPFKIFVGFFVDICRYLSEGCQTFFAKFVGNPMFPYLLIYVHKII